MARPTPSWEALGVLVKARYDPAGDGIDFDLDGLCDAGDADDDNDGALDGADANSGNPFACGDTDGDGCDDCRSGHLDPAHDADYRKNAQACQAEVDAVDADMRARLAKWKGGKVLAVRPVEQWVRSAGKNPAFAAPFLFFAISLGVYLSLFSGFHSWDLFSRPMVVAHSTRRIFSRFVCATVCSTSVPLLLFRTVINCPFVSYVLACQYCINPVSLMNGNEL